jgi:LacI family transcriptional regulator
MQVTLKDIAEKSGYSITTVSRALAGYSDVSQKTRQYIHQLAAEMGYQPNLVARQLRNQRTHTIGLVIPENEHTFADSFFSQLMMGIGRGVSINGYDLLISAQVPGDEEMAAYRRIVGGNRVDGMVVARTRQHDERIAYLKTQRIPFVVSGRLSPDKVSDFPYIDTDSQAGLRMAVNHLTELGHRHIGLILPPQEMAYSAYRFNGYCEGLMDANIPYRDDYVVMGDLQQSGGQRMAHHLLEQFPEITAIIACNDHMAFGAMRAVQEHQRRVGPDVAVIGFDDIPSAEHAHPALTTIRQPIFEIGQRLADMLIRILEGQTGTAEQVLLEPTLVIRESTRPASRHHG